MQYHADTEQLLTRITVNPTVMLGKPTIRGTRLTVEHILKATVRGPGRKHNGVLLLRLEDATGDEKAEVMRRILLSFSEQIEGKFCVFQNGRLRIR